MNTDLLERALAIRAECGLPCEVEDVERLRRRVEGSDNSERQFFSNCIKNATALLDMRKKR